MDEDLVTPWEVKACNSHGINYDKLIVKFGTSTIDDALIKRFERLIGKPVHHLLRRGHFFTHRDFDLILTAYEEGKQIYLYTGRGPSSASLHIGHLIPFIFTKWLQDVFNAPLIIQFTDDEKYLWKNISLKEMESYVFENIKDVLAVGFNINRVYVQINTMAMHQNPLFYPTVLSIQKHITLNQVKAIFGIKESDSIGKCAFPAIEAAPCFSAMYKKIFRTNENVRCLIPCAIDQDPFFRMSRDVAPKLRFLKPSLLLSKFIPSLQGAMEKMSSSDNSTSIFLSDSPKDIKNKINKYAFSGGKDTVDEHRKFGGDCSVDVAYQYLTFFMENDNKLNQIRKDYTDGTLLSGEMKNYAIAAITAKLVEFQERRKLITSDHISLVTNYRDLSL
ncbi:hypothetical protein A3Q56_00305 [Intoshia linei]|uniref:Tryptophan--tRNA ligase, cytoplasmic n=1 Tax=Intoshia linei TaxID=1819745 RepID=A0A177BCF4_9BILA|nr:hypothetical protein A3Q56_00305 [Intoshia linei]